MTGKAPFETLTIKYPLISRLLFLSPSGNSTTDNLRKGFQIAPHPILRNKHQVVFDTGSSSLEFASTLCATCTNQVPFDSTRSSTFRDGGRTSSITFATGVGVDPVIGANYRLTLRSATDTVSVGGLVAPNVSLFLITDQTPKFNIDPFSGIQGVSSRHNVAFG